MEILTPQDIWRGYNPDALPLSVSILSDKTINGMRTVLAYYNGKMTTDGAVRVFVRAFTRAKGDEKLPVIVIMPDASGSQIDKEVLDYVNKGYAVIVPDYLGTGGKSATMHTMYPPSLASSNFSYACFSERTTDVRRSPWIVWTEIFMRAVTFASSLSFVDPDKIAAIGFGISSSAAIKLAAVDRRVKCVISMYSSGYNVEGTDEIDLKYKAGVLDKAYAPLISVPFLMMVSSNDYNNSLDYMSELFSLVEQPNSRLSISERKNHSVGFKQKNNIDLFLKYCLSGRADDIPLAPKLVLSTAEHKLFYTVKCNIPDTEVSLFTAVDKREQRLRNWHLETLTPEGFGESTCVASVIDPRIFLHAFANVNYKEGFSFSTAVSSFQPGIRGVRGSDVKFNRLVYDNDLGTDDWLSLLANVGENEINMKKGPHGILGVHAESGELSTFKISDAQYLGHEGLDLQVTVYSSVKQDVYFRISAYEELGSKEDLVEFTAVKEAFPENGWSKIRLSTFGFKSASGAQLRWEHVALLKISAKSDFLISSLLWV